MYFTVKGGSREIKKRKMWAMEQSSSTSYKLSYVTSCSNHAHSHIAQISRVTRHQAVGFAFVARSCYKVVNPWTFLSFA